MKNRAKTPNFQANAEGEDLELMVYDAIGPDWMGMVSAKAVTDALNAHKDAKNVTVRINSPGGDAFDGIAIHNALASHPANVKTVAEGLAASAASIIFMAGDEREIHESAMLMIHDASGFTMGNAETHRQQMDVLNKLDGSIARVYAGKTGGDPETIRELMDEDTWLDADDAMADGYATAIVGGQSPSAHFDLSTLKNVPQNITERFGLRANPSTETETDNMTPEQFRAKYGDAVNDWINEGFTDGHATATQEINDSLSELIEAAGGDMAAALQAHLDGQDVDDVKAARVQSLEAKLADAEQRARDAEARADEADNGGDELPLNPQASIDNDADEEDEKRAEVKAKASKIENAYARAAFINSMGYDPSEFTFDND